MCHNIYLFRNRALNLLFLDYWCAVFWQFGIVDYRARHGTSHCRLFIVYDADRWISTTLMFAERGVSSFAHIPSGKGRPISVNFPAGANSLGIFEALTPKHQGQYYHYLHCC